ncbi:MAG: hypothetical protein EOP42_19690, partial [Sphingobacteriaceae bacterium]
MKTSAILLLSAFFFSASAQTKTTTSTNTNTTQTVKDDGKTLYISISSSKNGKEIKYDRTFAVAGMSAAQRTELVKKITDSLGVSQPPPAPAP